MVLFVSISQVALVYIVVHFRGWDNSCSFNFIVNMLLKEKKFVVKFLFCTLII